MPARKPSHGGAAMAEPAPVAPSDCEGDAAPEVSDADVFAVMALDLSPEESAERLNMVPAHYLARRATLLNAAASRAHSAATSAGLMQARLEGRRLGAPPKVTDQKIMAVMARNLPAEQAAARLNMSRSQYLARRKKLLQAQRMIKLWCYEDAPEMLRAMVPVRHAKDWLALIPTAMVNTAIPWMQDTSMRWSRVPNGILPDGSIIKVGTECSHPKPENPSPKKSR